MPIDTCFYEQKFFYDISKNFNVTYIKVSTYTMRYKICT